jgi:hypothetical protein
MPARRDPDPIFAALVESAKGRPVQGEPSEPVEFPFGDREYVGADGCHWRRRGPGPVGDGKRFLRLLRDPKVTVLHMYLWDPVIEIAPKDREAFWAGAVRKMEESRFADFVGTEYVDAQRRHLLIVSESC